MLREHFAWRTALHLYELARAALQPGSCDDCNVVVPTPEPAVAAISPGSAQVRNSTEAGFSTVLLLLGLVFITCRMGNALIRLGGRQQRCATAAAMTQIPATPDCQPSATYQNSLLAQYCPENVPKLALSPPPPLEQDYSDLPTPAEPPPSARVVEEPPCQVAPTLVVPPPTMTVTERQQLFRVRSDKENLLLPDGSKASHMTTVQLRKALRAAGIAYSDADKKDALIAKLQGRAAQGRAVQGPPSASPARTVLGACSASERVYNIARMQGFGAFQAPAKP